MFHNSLQLNNATISIIENHESTIEDIEEVFSFQISLIQLNFGSDKLVSFFAYKLC